MPANVHFETAGSWDDARRLVSFTPREPAYPAGLPLQSLRVHVRVHKLREVDRTSLTLEAHYGQFVLSRGTARSRPVQTYQALIRGPWTMNQGRTMDHGRTKNKDLRT